jgi:glucose-6-phosphate dehydrogenase assembly protein OpcA
MPEHPARAIVIRVLRAGERTLSDRVYAQCWMPFGQRRQICCEQVEITASDAAMADLPSVVLPLAVADLPLILWCRSPRVAGMREFGGLAAMARKIILDSARFDDPQEALRFLTAMAPGALVGDLAWTRLTRWREMLAQVFENRRYLENLPRITKVRMAFPPEYETSARYLAAWVGNVLSDAGVTAEIAMVQADGLRLALEGADFRLELAREERRLTVTVDHLTNCTNLPPPSDYMQMREELGIVERDPIFERALASAAQLAYPGN